MNTRRPRISDARQRIMETAERLFYTEGVRAVGIDRIIAEAAVAKMTLYKHFASKDALIVAVVQQQEGKIQDMFQAAITQYIHEGMNRLEAFFAALHDWFDSPGFRGCAFINAYVELADSRHPASQFSAAHKVRFHTMLRDIITTIAGARVAAAVAPAVALLVEGAIVRAVMEQSSHAAEVAREATLSLIAQATGKA